MKYWMYAIDKNSGQVIGHKGDSGGMSNSIRYDPPNPPSVTLNSGPTLGESMQVGSIYGRTFSAQDWWLTTPVTSIVAEYEQDGERFVLFETLNSMYLWKEF